MYNIITELFSKLGNLSFITLLLCILILATIIMCAYVFFKVLILRDVKHITKFSVRHLPVVLTIIIEIMLFNYEFLLL